MLKMPKIELELMSDINMFQFIEKGTRGGIMHRYGKANNKQMQNYVEELVMKYIMYTYTLITCTAGL